MRACAAAGLRVPAGGRRRRGAVAWETAGIVMTRVEGEALARRILRDDEFADGPRPASPRDLRRVPRRAPRHRPRRRPGPRPTDPIERHRAQPRLSARPSPTVELAFRWLEATAPPEPAEVIVHGDLRLGNVLVGPEGLTAALDWELVHRGNPVEDLGWLCTKAWRFGRRCRSAGFGTREELLAAYRAAGGVDVDLDELRWWEVLNTLKWGVGCMGQAAVHLHGRGPLRRAGRHRPAGRASRSGTCSCCSPGRRRAPPQPTAVTEVAAAVEPPRPPDERRAARGGRRSSCATTSCPAPTGGSRSTPGWPPTSSPSPGGSWPPDRPTSSGAPRSWPPSTSPPRPSWRRGSPAARSTTASTSVARRARLRRRAEARRRQPEVPDAVSRTDRPRGPMGKPMHETERLSFDGAVDADGHILEPPDLWETYLEPQYRDRALRFVLDETGSRSSRSAAQPSRDEPARLPVDARRDGRPRPRSPCSSTPSAPTCREAPFGSMDPDERLKVLDAEGIDAVVLYTTVGLLWEAELDDPELTQAYTRAYNRWICEFCAGQRPARADRAPVARRPGRGRGRARAGGRRGRPRRLRRAVHPRRPAARPSRQRPGVRGRPGPRRALRHPPDVRAAVDEGHPHGRVGERQAAAPAGVGDGVRRRAPPVHDAVRLRRVRPLPAAQGARARVGRRLDRLLARPHRRRLRPHVHRHPGAAEGQAERLLPRAGLDLVRSRRAHDPAAGRAVRRRPVPVGVGLPPRRPHARVHRRPRRAGRGVRRRRPRGAFLGDNARALFEIPETAWSAPTEPHGRRAVVRWRDAPRSLGGLTDARRRRLRGRTRRVLGRRRRRRRDGDTAADELDELDDHHRSVHGSRRRRQGLGANVEQGRPYIAARPAGAVPAQRVRGRRRGGGVPARRPSLRPAGTHPTRRVHPAGLGPRSMPMPYGAVDCSGDVPTPALRWSRSPWPAATSPPSPSIRPASSSSTSSTPTSVRCSRSARWCRCGGRRRSPPSTPPPSGSPS